MSIHFQLSQGEAWVLVPSVVVKYLKEASAAELRVLLALLSQGRNASEQTVCDALGITPSELAACVESWLSRGVLSMQGRFVVLTPPSAELAKPAVARGSDTRRPTYQMDLVWQELEKKPDLRSALRTAQTILNREFSQTEYEVLYSLYDYYGLSPETILLLMGHCAARGRTSCKALEELAAEWHRRGISTPEEASAYIEDESRKSDAQSMVRRLFSLGQRRLSPNEKAFIARWTGDFRYGEDMLEAAYNRCVDVTGKLSFSYIDKILTSWHVKGIDSVEQAMAEQPPPRRTPRKKPAPDTATPSSSNLKEFSEWAFQAIYGPAQQAGAEASDGSPAAPAQQAGSGAQDTGDSAQADGVQNDTNKEGVFR